MSKREREYCFLLTYMQHFSDKISFRVSRMCLQYCIVFFFLFLFSSRLFRCFVRCEISAICLMCEGKRTPSSVLISFLYCCWCSKKEKLNRRIWWINRSPLKEFITDVIISFSIQSFIYSQLDCLCVHCFRRSIDIETKETKN